MHSFYNIEKSGFRRGECVGYAAGDVWRIRKTGTGGWEAFGRDLGGYLRAPTLEVMSSRLAIATENAA